MNLTLFRTGFTNSCIYIHIYTSHLHMYLLQHSGPKQVYACVCVYIYMYIYTHMCMYGIFMFRARERA